MQYYVLSYIVQADWFVESRTFWLVCLSYAIVLNHITNTWKTYCKNSLAFQCFFLISLIFEDGIVHIISIWSIKYLLENDITYNVNKFISLIYYFLCI